MRVFIACWSCHGAGATHVDAGAAGLAPVRCATCSGYLVVEVVVPGERHVPEAPTGFRSYARAEGADP